MRILSLLAAAVLSLAPVLAARALPPLRAELVDDATLATQRGKYYGANLLVGLRIDLVSTLAGPGGSASAAGSLYVRRVGNGYEVYVDSRALATAGGATLPGGELASGGETIVVDGIGQVAQIAGDDNRMTNLTRISIVPAGSVDASGFNGQGASAAADGGMSARITFLDGGIQLGLSGTGAGLTQQLRDGGGLMQVGQLAGNGIVGSNQLQLQVLGAAMPRALLNQFGIQQALAGMAGVGR